jgi:mannose/fructose/N-acetylgalactosamine-specific phosphotransferase system component IIC
MIAAAGLGGLAALDRTAFAQTMLAHPVVCGTLAGWVAGDPQSGLRLGLVLGLFASRRAPIGGEGPLIDWTSAAVAVPFALREVAAGWQWGLGLVAGLALALLGGQLIGLVRALAARRDASLGRAVGVGDLDAIERFHTACLVLHFARGAVLVVLGATSIRMLAFDVAWTGAEQAAAGMIWSAAPVAGAVVLLHAQWRHAGRAPVALGFGLALLLLIVAQVGS